jgi:hypothetical protein
MALGTILGLAAPPGLRKIKPQPDRRTMSVRVGPGGTAKQRNRAWWRARGTAPSRSASFR